jgi:hypothetical protein
MMYGEPRLEPDWVNDSEWDEDLNIDCEEEVESHPEGVECNDYCAPEDGNHLCGFSGDVNASCVGQATYTAYFACPQCKTEGQKEMDSREY